MSDLGSYMQLVLPRYANTYVYLVKLYHNALCRKDCMVDSIWHGDRKMSGLYFLWFHLLVKNSCVITFPERLAWVLCFRKYGSNFSRFTKHGFLTLDKKWSFSLILFSKCDWKLRIWSHLLKKSFMKNFIFCAVKMENFATIIR